MRNGEQNVKIWDGRNNVKILLTAHCETWI